jgi:hypothetical protein
VVTKKKLYTLKERRKKKIYIKKERKKKKLSLNIIELN